jgi:AcrR family transcriptional regulator
MLKPDKREDIVRAAMELIAENGFHGAPMAAIAERAGVGAGTIYRYFKNKDLLITDSFAELEREMIEFITVGYSKTLPVRERFLHLSRRVVIYFVDNPLHFKYLEQFHNSPYGAERRRDKMLAEARKHDVFRVLFRDGLNQRVIKDLPIPILYSLAFGPLVLALRDHTLGFIDLHENLIDQITLGCWDGVRR